MMFCNVINTPKIHFVAEGVLRGIEGYELVSNVALDIEEVLEVPSTVGFYCSIRD